MNGEVNPKAYIRSMKVMEPHAGSARTIILPLLSTIQDLLLRLYLAVNLCVLLQHDPMANMLTKDHFVQGLEPLKCSICLDDYSTE